MNVSERQPHRLSLRHYDLEDMREIVELRSRLSLDADVESIVDRGAQVVQSAVDRNECVYGVNSGFGSLCETGVPADQLRQLQYNHVISHACGVGPPIPPEIARWTMLIKLLTLRSGQTGASVGLLKRLIEFWNYDLIPVIPAKGSLGASGDLALLAHLALPVLGLGEVYQNGTIVSAADAMAAVGMEPYELRAKEGLALTNGVQFINAIAAEAVLTCESLARIADLVAAMSIQAFSCSSSFYQSRYTETSHHPERQSVARNLQKLLVGSNHDRLPHCNRSRQDPYSFRCIPQVHAAVRQAVAFCHQIVERECNGVSDNPLFFAEPEEILTGGNLHGASTAMALDFLCIALCELSSISERRTYQLISGQRGLPDYLVDSPGLNSGLMILQYTSAALVNESKVLSTPASVDTIMTSQGQEDHVSMGGTAANKLRQVVDNACIVLGSELLTAVQAVDQNKELQISQATRTIHDEVREKISFIAADRILSNDIEAARLMLGEQMRRWIGELSLE